MTAGPAPHAPVVIGLDVGTTAAKAAAFAVGSPGCSVAVREYALEEPRPGWAVQDPAAVVAAAAEALASCVAATGGAPVLAISVSAGMHGLMALDAECRPLTALVTWADGRARDEAIALAGSADAMPLRARTGVPVHPMTPLSKLRWYRRHEPATFAEARWWVGLKDYVLWCLTGDLVTELSSASATGLLDLYDRRWSGHALELAGVREEELPPILATTATRSLATAVAELVGLPSGTPVVVGAGDGPLGNLGSGAITPGLAGLNVGTSAAVRVPVDVPRAIGDAALCCFALTDDLWIVGGALSTGGAALRWAARALAPDLAAGFGEGGPDDAVLALAESVEPGSDGLVMLPYLAAERAPLWHPDLAGAFLGLRREHTRAHLTRAAVEGVCLQTRLVLDRLDELEPIVSVRATGGAFRNRLWRDVMAAVLDRPVTVVGAAEGTARGAAALGLCALGVADSLEGALVALPTSAGTRPVDPDPSLVATYADLRARVPELLDALAPVAAAFARAPAG